MNKDQAKKHMPIIQALAEGKPIQFFDDIFGEWQDVSSLSFGSDCVYRIKPEPRTFYVFICIKETEEYDIGEMTVILESELSEDYAKTHNSEYWKLVTTKEVL